MEKSFSKAQMIRTHVSWPKLLRGELSGSARKAAIGEIAASAGATRHDVHETLFRDLEQGNASCPCCGRVLHHKHITALRTLLSAKSVRGVIKKALRELQEG